MKPKTAAVIWLERTFAAIFFLYSCVPNGVRMQNLWPVKVSAKICAAAGKLPNLCRGRAVSGAGSCADSGAVLSLGRAQNGLVFESGSGGLSSFFFSFSFSFSLSLLPLIGTDSDCDYKEGGGRITNRTGNQPDRSDEDGRQSGSGWWR